ncbi:MAG TPA: NAD-dependent epimerase/dehydratase family protein [Polyangiaceae bacterium]|nr:NAD-dependent epimerase/dehydratase family protein [Polyangiaceae bacterium]
MRVFVTGATGLLGNNLVRALRARGHEVRALVRSRNKADALLAGTGAEIVVGDMRDISGFERALAGIDAVAHTAAYFREYYAPGDHQSSLEEINIKGTLALLASADAHGVRRFVQTSSAGTVGNPTDGSEANEESPASEAQLANLYFKSKVDGDRQIGQFSPKSDMTIATVLPGWMFGPGDAGPTRAGELILDALAGKLPGVPPGGTTIVDARDVASAMVTLLERDVPGERFIVAGRFHTIRELLDAAMDAAGKARISRSLPAWLALGLGHVTEAWARLTNSSPLVPLEGVRMLLQEFRPSSAKAQRELGVTFRPLPETIRDVVTWYGAHSELMAPAGRQSVATA